MTQQPPPVTWSPPQGPPVVAPGSLPRAPREAGGPWLLWILVAVAIVGTGVVVGDWAARNWEMGRLLTAVEGSESAMQTAKDRISAAQTPGGREREPTPEEIRKARDEISGLAEEGRGQVQSRGQDVAAVSFLPWHAELLAAQAAYLDHNGAWVEYLSNGSEDPVSLVEGDNRISPTWEVAQNTFRATLPPLAWPWLSDEVETIFFDEEEDNASPGVAA